MDSTQQPLAVGGGTEQLQSRGGQVLPLWSVMTVAFSAAAIFTRYCGLPAASVGFWRVMGAGVVMLPWFILTARRVRPRPVVSWGAVLTGLVLGLHFGSWAWALLHGRLANAALFIAMQPAITPVLGHMVSRDRLNAREYLGTALSCAGMLFVLGTQLAFDRKELPASLVALFSMLCCAIYLVMGRKFRTREHVTLFSVPVYLAAAGIQLVPALLSRKLLPDTLAGGAAVAGMILVPTVGGHTLAMYLLKHTKAHTVALSVPVQLVIITVAGMILFDQWPMVWFYPGAILVVAGVLLAIAAGTETVAKIAPDEAVVEAAEL